MATTIFRQNEEWTARAADLNTLFSAIASQIGGFILGKDEQIRLALCCLLAKGHLLIEDIPGIGKTTLAKVLARALGLDFQRIQCTSDMLPGDILGVAVFDPRSGAFSFHQGPVFTQILLADEINRTTPKTQSALLEAMEEQQVSIEGETRALPSPFFVIATQNPIEQVGTYPLPESQLDRFLMKISIGYPGREAERQLLAGGGKRMDFSIMKSLLGAKQLFALQQHVENIHLSAALIEYVQNLLEFSRRSQMFSLGLSPRAGLALCRAAQAWALLSGRDYVLPEDVQHVLPYVTIHRLRRADTSLGLSLDELRLAFEPVAVTV